MALNARLALRFDGPVDPLGVTRQSVEVRRDDGRPLAAQIDTIAGDLVVELEVGPGLLADPPAAVVVQLQGSPSAHALRIVGGRRLRAPVTVRCLLDARLEGSARAAPRLQAINGQALPLSGPVLADGVLSLLFEGVIDPATISPENCPLDPLEHGLALKPLLPRVDWSCVGQRFELLLDAGRATGALQLNLARFGLRDFSGRSPEPLLKTEIRAS